MKRNLGIILAITFLALFVAYGGFEVAKVSLGPTLSVTTPRDMSTVNDSLIKVTGKVNRAAYISIDDRQIYADGNGEFSESLLLLSGYNIIKVQVKDRYGKEATRLIHIYYAPVN